MGVLAAAILGFSLGISAHLLWDSELYAASFAALLAAVSLVAYWQLQRMAYLLTALFLLCVALGIGRAAFVHSGLPEAFRGDLRQRVAYEGVVVGDPEVRDNAVRVPVRVREAGTQMTVLMVAPRSVQAAVGDSVRITGTLLPPAPFETDGGRTFAYDKYLAVRGMSALVEYGSLTVEKSPPWYSVPAALARVKHWFLGGLHRALPEPEASLAGGVVIGGKSGLGPELQDAFTKTGLVQIIVLSGYNVMIVAQCVMYLLATLRFSRRWAALAGALALLLFVGIAGLSATAVRAALMALVALYARATGKSYAASRALLVVVLLMLVWNPLLLPYDPGFDLSVAATAGLIWLAPLIELWLGRVTSTFWREAVATTLAAQLAVLPLLLYETGNLSVVAVPANLLVAPVVPLFMGLAALAGVLGASAGALIPPLAALVGAPAYATALYVIGVARSLSAPSWAAYTVATFPFWLVPLAYAALAALATSKRASTTDQSVFSKKASIYLPLSAGR